MPLTKTEIEERRRKSEKAFRWYLWGSLILVFAGYGLAYFVGVPSYRERVAIEIEAENLDPDVVFDPWLHLPTLAIVIAYPVLTVSFATILFMDRNGVGSWLMFVAWQATMFAIFGLFRFLE